MVATRHSVTAMNEPYMPPDVVEMKKKIYTMIADCKVRIQRHEIIGNMIPQFAGKTVVRKAKELEVKLNLLCPEAPLEPDKGVYHSKEWRVSLHYHHWLVYPGEHRIAEQADDAPYARFDLSQFNRLDYWNHEGAQKNIAKLNKFIDDGCCELLSDLCRKFAHIAVAWQLLLNETGLEYTFKNELKNALDQGALYLR
jgi:hypothetical protein